jgi:hypothetical protein
MSLFTKLFGKKQDDLKELDFDPKPNSWEQVTVVDKPEPLNIPVVVEALPEVTETPIPEPPKKRKPGRPPTKYSPEAVQKFKDLTQEGKTMRQIGDIMDVSPNTLVTWKNKDLELRVAINKFRNEIDEQVEAGLFKRATGYTYREEFVTRDGVQELTKHTPPDVQAIQFWLKNRKSKDWRDTQQHEINVVKTIEFETSDGSTEKV